MTALAGGAIRMLDDATRFLRGLSASSIPERRAGAGMKRARGLVAAIGNPQDVRAVHVAGTAGKGSMVAFVANILRCHGMSVGAHLSSEGRHQIESSGTALRVVAELVTRDGRTLRPDPVHRGLSWTTLPDPFERRMWRTYELVLDIAPNPVKRASLMTGLKDAFPSRGLPWVLALEQDKDVRGALEVIAPVASTVIATWVAAPSGEQPPLSSFPAPFPSEAARRSGIPSVRIVADPHAALEQAVELSTTAQPIVVAGSFQLLAAIFGAVSR